jgi:hypothetical protein
MTLKVELETVGAVDTCVPGIYGEVCLKRKAGLCPCVPCLACNYFQADRQTLEEFGKMNISYLSFVTKPGRHGEAICWLRGWQDDKYLDIHLVLSGQGPTGAEKAKAIVELKDSGPGKWPET